MKKIGFKSDEYSLEAHQDKTIKFLSTDNYGKMVILGTGLGKTLICQYYYRLQSLRYNKVKMIVVSENNLIPQFEEDYDKFFHNADDHVTVLMDKPEIRERKYKQLIRDKDILLLNYNSVSTDIDILERIVKYCRVQGYKVILALDEAENVSNHTSGITVGVQRLMDYVTNPVAMTASPLKNRLDKTQTILEVVRAKHVPNREDFLKDHCKIEIMQVIQLNYLGKRCGYPLNIRGEYSDKKVSEAYGSMWAFVKDTKYFHKLTVISTENCDFEVHNEKKTFKLSIPQTYEGKFRILMEARTHQGNRVPVELTGWCSRIQNVKGYKDIKGYYEKIKKSVISYSKSQAGKLPEFQTMLKTFDIAQKDKEFSALRSIYDDQKDKVNYATETISTVTPEVTLYEYNEIDSVSKTDTSLIVQGVLDVSRKVLDNGGKIIIFTKYTQIAEYFIWYWNKQRYFSNHEIGYVRGGMSKKELDGIKKSFREGLDVLIVTESGLRGLNLQVANHIACLDMPVSFGDLLQLAGRVSRLGSVHKYAYLYLFYIKDTITEDLYKMVMGQGALVKEFDPNLLEAGILDSRVEEVALDIKASEYTKQGLKKRMSRFITKKKR